MIYQVGTSLYNTVEEAHDALAEWYLTADGLNSKHDIEIYQETPLVSAVDYEHEAGDMVQEWYDRNMMVAAIMKYQPES